MKLPWQRLMSFRVSSFVSPAVNGVTESSNRRIGGPFLQEQVKIRLSTQWNRAIHPDPTQEAMIDTVWQQYRASAPRLFNATKFRLHSWTQLTDAADPPALVFHWGLTDYKTYLGTCCSQFVTDLLHDGLTLKQDAFAFLSRKVGVAAVLETSDGYIALIKRSKSVGVYQDMYDTPGGHPEPTNIGLATELLEELEKSGQEARRAAMEDAVVREFFGSIMQEVHEEVNVGLEDLSAPLLLGVVHQAEAQTPSFSFYMKSSCSAAEVRALYRAGPPDKFESVQLELFEAKKFLEMPHDAPFLDQLTPSARGTLMLWKEYARTQRQL